MADAACVANFPIIEAVFKRADVGKSFVLRGDLGCFACNFFWFMGLEENWGRGWVSALLFTAIQAIQFWPNADLRTGRRRLGRVDWIELLCAD